MIDSCEYRSHVVFRGSAIDIGSFYCPQGSPLWITENIAAASPMLVFPRTSVRIIQEDRKPVVASPNCIMFYNTDQFYHREQIGTQPDQCEYFYVRPEVILDVYRSLGIDPPNDAMSPFGFTHAPCTPRMYLLQRWLYNQLRSGDNHNVMQLEETFLMFLEDAIARAASFHDELRPMRASTLDTQIELVESAKEYIGLNFRNTIQLDELADSIGSSVFHLCRVFRKLTDMTIHSFILQMRLRSTLQEVIDKKNPSLTDVALDYGFSSHSHFTNSFRNQFGVSPSRLRIKKTGAIDSAKIHSIFEATDSLV